MALRAGPLLCLACTVVTGYSPAPETLLSDGWHCMCPYQDTPGVSLPRVFLPGASLPGAHGLYVFSGGLESRSLVQGVGGRSVSMKAPPASRSRHGPFKTVPLRWSFGHREKRPGASVELVEYLESRRRPRSTSQSIVPLLTRTAGGEETAVTARSDVTLPARSEDSGRAIGQGTTGVPLSTSHLNHHPALGSSDDGGQNTARTRTGNASQDIKLPKKFDLPLTVMPSVGDEKPARPEGQKLTTWKGSGQVESQSSPPSPSIGLFSYL